MSQPTGAPAPNGGARELAHRAMRGQISLSATELFLARGYARTTIDDVCAATGISRSSFFRYFGSKEEVLLQDLSDIDEDLLAALIARPNDEAAWLAIRRALDAVLSRYLADPEQTLRRAKVVIATPALLSIHREKLTRWVRLLGPELSRRLEVTPDGLPDPRPAALVAAALACLDVAVATWAGADGEPPLADLLDRAMAPIY